MDTKPTCNVFYMVEQVKRYKNVQNSYNTAVVAFIETKSDNVLDDSGSTFSTWLEADVANQLNKTEDK